ncbi:TIGR03086 family metal-binding protein [Streptomyces sp. 796.1]|uniref:TIGR03086 family metal-binding protein n=1 Tax=Streptomyces sp. 796.1 TaxID=3163029 RepID=UPI0039C9BBDE
MSVPSDRPDLGPAADRMAALLSSVSDDELGAPTPCARYALGDLIDHVDGLAHAFALAAAKDFDALGSAGPSGDAGRLGPDWRERLPRRLAALAEAWRSPNAWQGMTRAGGVDLPGEVAGLVALNELTVHGWDVARATGQPFTAEPALVAACLTFVAQAPAADDADPGDGLFGPPVTVPADAPPLDQLLGRTGRRPDWTPA